MVCGNDSQPVAGRRRQNRLERVLGRAGFGNGCGTRGILDWNRDPWIDRIAVVAMWLRGAPTDIWPSEPLRRDGLELDDG